MLTEIACRSESGLCRLGFARLVRLLGRRPCGVDPLALQIFLFPFRPFGVPLHPVQLDLAFLFPLISAIGPVMRVAVRRIQVRRPQSVRPTAEPLGNVASADDLTWGRGPSPMFGAAPQITSQFRQRIPGMTLRKGPVLLVQSRPCPFCDVLFVPVLAVKILSACDLPHRGTPPPCS